MELQGNLIVFHFYFKEMKKKTIWSPKRVGGGEVCCLLLIADHVCVLSHTGGETSTHIPSHPPWKDESVKYLGPKYLGPNSQAYCIIAKNAHSVVMWGHFCCTWCWSRAAGWWCSRPNQQARLSWHVSWLPQWGITSPTFCGGWPTTTRGLLDIGQFPNIAWKRRQTQNPRNKEHLGFLAHICSKLPMYYGEVGNICD